MREKKIICICFVVASIFIMSPAFGQENILSTPEATITALFKSMRDGDSTMANHVFAKGATLNSVYTTKEGDQTVNAGEIDAFITAIGTPHEDTWDEQISNLKVTIDGDLAQAWMDYSFYLTDKFSHCGVNAMHLIRKKGEWKIFQIVDTRRKTDCN